MPLNQIHLPESAENGKLELRRTPVPSWLTDRECASEFERDILIAIHQQDITQFRASLVEKETDMSKYSKAINKCMEISCDRPGYGEFIEALLAAKFNPNAIIVKPGITAIHLATINGNTSALQALLSEEKTNVNMISGHGKLALHYVAERIIESADDEEIIEKCIKLLLEHPSIDVNKCSITNWTLNGNALHLAARTENHVVMKALLEDGRIDVNAQDSYGWTALHYAVRNCRNSSIAERISRNCCLLLLSDSNIDVNKETYKTTFKITALHLAAAAGNAMALEALIKDKRTHVGVLDNRQRSALHYAAEQSLPHVEVVKRNRLAIASMVHFPEIDFNCPDFYEWIAIHSAASKGNFAYIDVMLQEDGGTEQSSAEINKKITSRRLAQSHIREEDKERIRECIYLLIDHPDIDINGFSYMGLTENLTPIILAAKSGNYVALEELMKDKRTAVDIVDQNNRTLLHYAVEQYDSDRAQRCVALLLQRSDKYGGTLETAARYKHDVDAKDNNGNTALHLAAQHKAQQLVLTLLRYGASIAITGKQGSPISQISAKVFDDFLNECLETNGKSSEDEHFQLAFSYTFLKRNDTDAANCYPESDPLYHMSTSKRTRHLLKHPVLRSFLDLKWRRVRNYFYVNVIYHILFVILLNIFIVDKVCAGDSHPDYSDKGFEFFTLHPSLKQKFTDDNSECTPILTSREVRMAVWVILKFFLLGLGVKEAFQILVSPFRYVSNIENYLELLLIASSIVSMNSTMLLNATLINHMAATTILISWTQLVFLTGRLPMMSCQLEMLKKVTWTFLRFLTWYSFIIIAFSLTFFVLFYEEDYQPKGSDKFFMRPYTSLLKSVTMMAGEFDASYTPFSAAPITSHILFAVFVFLVSIVMLNLLSGLAVSDTHYIRQQAEVLSLVSRVRLVYYIENMMLGDPIATWWMGRKIFSFFRGKCIWFGRINRSILLFPQVVLENKIWVLPNRENRVLFIEPRNMANENIQVSYTFERSCCKYLTLDANIVKSAMDIINFREGLNMEGDALSRSVSSPYIKKFMKEIESRSRENTKMLQKTIQRKLETLRNRIDYNVKELEVKLQIQLKMIEKTEEENKKLLNVLLQRLNSQGRSQK